MKPENDLPQSNSDATASRRKCSISLTEVTIDYRDPADPTEPIVVLVRGTARGTQQMAVSLRGGVLTEPLSATADVDAGRWETTFSVPPEALPAGSRITVSASSVDKKKCDAVAERIVWLNPDESEVLGPAAGCPSGLEKDRNRFVAGYADRFVASRVFSPLLCSFWTPTIRDQQTAVTLASGLGDLPEDVDALAEKFATRLAALGDQFEQGLPADQPVDMRAARQVVAQAYMEVFRPQAPPERTSAGGNEADAGEARAAGGASALAGGQTVASPVIGDWRFARVTTATSPEEVPTVLAGSQGTVVTTDGDPVGVLEGVESYFDIGWLGVIFYDRLRIRPSGLVAGDEAYSLALAPGEEVTLTQRSETKRSFSFEEVVDRAMEQELEFNSTWSTGFTQQDANTDASSTGGNLGASVGVDLFGVLTVGLNAGVSVQDSHTRTTSQQSQLNQQTTRRVAAKAREQHKTTFRVGTEAIEEFGSRRVLRNANPGRALTLRFFKLYQKNRILLERYDAKLGISLCLDDPGFDARQELSQELAKLDPRVPAGACPEVPGAGQVSQTIVATNPVPGAGGTVDAVFTATLPPGTVLSDWQFVIANARLQVVGTTVDLDETKYRQFGGSATFDVSASPQIGSSGPQRHVVRITMLAFPPYFSTVSVTGTLTWSYVASSAISEEVRTCIAQELAKIRGSFSASRVMQILAEVRSGSRELVVKRLFEQTLLASVYPGGVNPPCELLERIRLCFDWNEATIQYLPWWMTANGRKYREELRQQLLRLPGDVRSDLVIEEFLVASKARVYLPIKPGCEREAIRLLYGRGPHRCVDDFIAWRGSTFGSTSRPIPGFADVTAIGPPLATPAGATDWAYDWERPRAKFLVLDEWAELLPTDGVHVEPSLSTCGGTDEFRTSALTSDLRTSAALQDSERARAELERALASRSDLGGAVVVLGQPLGG